MFLIRGVLHRKLSGVWFFFLLSDEILLTASPTTNLQLLPPPASVQLAEQTYLQAKQRAAAPPPAPASNTATAAAGSNASRSSLITKPEPISVVRTPSISTPTTNANGSASAIVFTRLQSIEFACAALSTLTPYSVATSTSLPPAPMSAAMRQSLQLSAQTHSGGWIPAIVTHFDATQRKVTCEFTVNISARSTTASSSLLYSIALPAADCRIARPPTPPSPYTAALNASKAATAAAAAAITTTTAPTPASLSRALTSSQLLPSPKLSLPSPLLTPSSSVAGAGASAVTIAVVPAVDDFDVYKLVATESRLDVRDALGR